MAATTFLAAIIISPGTFQLEDYYLLLYQLRINFDHVADREDALTEAVMFWNSLKIEKMPLQLKGRLSKVYGKLCRISFSYKSYF